MSLTNSGLGTVVGVTIDARIVAPGLAAAPAVELDGLWDECTLALPHAARTELSAEADMPTTAARVMNCRRDR